MNEIENADLLYDGEVLDFIAAAIRALDGKEPDRHYTFTCPVCGGKAVAHRNSYTGTATCCWSGLTGRPTNTASNSRILTPGCKGFTSTAPSATFPPSCTPLPKTGPSRTPIFQSRSRFSRRILRRRKKLRNRTRRNACGRWLI